MPSIVILLAALAATALAYRPGLGGSVHFDDPHNLGGLTRVSDLASALDYLGDGVAGPLGRPLALASFAAQAYAWPDSLDVLLYTNVCIHLLNGVLVTWLMLLLVRASGETLERAGWLAAVSGALWMLLPLLASASLMTVQRMTTLSATFLFVGFVCFLYGRRMLEARPKRALLVMLAALGVGTTLSALTKENGALLPALVLIAEATILPTPRGAAARRARAVLLALLALPAAAVAAYLVSRFAYSDAALALRGFSAADRLVTQAHILWEYLARAFVPAVQKLGPFHDDYTVRRAVLEPTTVVAAGSWCVVIAAAVLLRKRVPMLAFAVGWYLVGHSVESTVLPLELYFEHRNYVPIVGPVLALVAGINYEARKIKFLYSALAVYVAAIGGVLLSLTSLWGQPVLAGHMWSMYHPESTRAVHYLARLYAQHGNAAHAARILSLRLERKPDEIGTALRLLGYACLVQRRTELTQLSAISKTLLAKGDHVKGVPKPLGGLLVIAKQHRCPGLTPEDVRGLAAAAERNPLYRAVPNTAHDLNVVLAEDAFERGDLALAMQHWEQALAYRRTFEALSGSVKTLVGLGDREAALRLVDEATAWRPSHPLRARLWQRRVEQLKANVVSLRR